MDNEHSSARADTPPDERSLAEPGRDEDLGPAIARLEPDTPLLLFDSFFATDGGHLAVSQYVDVGSTKLRRRPRVLIKAIEAQYGLEHAPTLRLSAPRRFRDYGETFIEDDQEGRANRERRTQSGPGTDGAKAREQRRAFAALGAADADIATTHENTHTESNALTFGNSSWIYCTSMKPLPRDRESWRNHLSHRYDHESVIRQPARFAQALASMHSDQIGPQTKRDKVAHPRDIRSIHEGQMVFHGPVWYTDDVFGFLRTLESDPWHMLYALFVKDIAYKPQREYRFVVHCETPTEHDWLDLLIPGAMRDALAPPNRSAEVRFEQASVDNDGPSSQMTGCHWDPTGHTTTRTRRTTERQNLKLTEHGVVVEETALNLETVVTLTTHETPGEPENGNADASVTTGQASGRLRRERVVAGAQVELIEEAYMRVLGEADKPEFDQSFTIDDLDRVKAVMEAARRPFAEFETLQPHTLVALTALAEQLATIEPEHEVEAMSAGWNAIWAISNLCLSFGDVVASVELEDGKFVAISLQNAANGDAAGRLMVGPRGTYAYVLTRGDKQSHGRGGKETRLYLLPDESVRTAFEEFGWIVHGDDI